MEPIKPLSNALGSQLIRRRSLVYKYSSVQDPVVNSSFNVSKVIKAVPRWMWNNKFKTFFLIVLIYVGRKIYCIYHDWVKPFLDLKNGMSDSMPK